MARISGVDLPRDKRIEIGLTYVYGIGRATSNRLLKEAGVNPDTRVRDLTDEEVGKIRDAIDADSILIEGDLRREIAINIKRLQEIGCPILSVVYFGSESMMPIHVFISRCIVVLHRFPNVLVRRMDRCMISHGPRLFGFIIGWRIWLMLVMSL